jgi:lipoprotein-anchoring transpeptidase ErfK/SrfK
MIALPGRAWGVTAIACAIAFSTATPAMAGQAATDMTLVAAAASMRPGAFQWADAAIVDAATGPVAIVVSLADQRAYVYRGQQIVAVTSVSTGKEGKETPVGVFTILQKKKMNYSNLYDGAPMPWMQRLTWDGIAIHAGANPGFPASHGCIRMPAAFAKKLFELTALGAVVEVTDLPFIEGSAPQISEAQQVAAANRAAAGGTPAPEQESLGAFLASR